MGYDLNAIGSFSDNEFTGSISAKTTTATSVPSQVYAGGIIGRQAIIQDGSYFHAEFGIGDASAIKTVEVKYTPEQILALTKRISAAIKAKSPSADAAKLRAIAEQIVLGGTGREQYHVR